MNFAVVEPRSDHLPELRILGGIDQLASGATAQVDHHFGSSTLFGKVAVWIEDFEVKFGPQLGFTGGCVFRDKMGANGYYFWLGHIARFYYVRFFAC